MNITQTVAFVGEAMIELTPRPGSEGLAGMTPAGDVLNTAVYFRRSSKREIGTRFVTVIGEDSFSDRIFRFAQDEGLDTSGMRRTSQANCGLYAVATAENGERSFSYWRSASAARTLFSNPADFEALTGCGIVLITGITLAILPDTIRDTLLDWVKAARTRGVRLAFDSNYRPALWESQITAQNWVERFWRVCDIALPSVDDEIALFGDAGLSKVMKRFGGYGVTTGALKAGVEGSFALDGTDRRFAVEPVDTVVDTTAAGDSFNAGFLSALVTGAPLEDCVAAAHALAREVIQHPGAIIPRVAK